MNYASEKPKTAANPRGRRNNVNTASSHDRRKLMLTDRVTSEGPVNIELGRFNNFEPKLNGSQSQVRRLGTAPTAIDRCRTHRNSTEKPKSVFSKPSDFRIKTSDYKRVQIKFSDYETQDLVSKSAYATEMLFKEAAKPPNLELVYRYAKAE